MALAYTGPPGSYCAVIAAGHNQRPVGRAGERCDRAAVTLPDAAAGTGPFPGADCTVLAAGEDPAAGCGYRDRGNRPAVTGEDIELLRAGSVPDPDRAIVAAGDDVPAVGCDGDRC